MQEINRAELKRLAKAKFTGNYWPCVVVLLISALLSISIAAMRFDGIALRLGDAKSTYAVYHLLKDDNLLVILSMILNILIIGPLTAGLQRFYLLNTEESQEFSTLFYYFTSWDNYKLAFCRVWLMLIKIEAWSLLLCVPGVVKALEYGLVIPITTIHPELDRKEVYALSKKLMYGYKWQLFVLYLSFIPWLIATVLTFGLVGVFYATPYMYATYGEFWRSRLAEIQ